MFFSFEKFSTSGDFVLSKSKKPMKIQKEFISTDFGLVQQNMPTLSKAHARGLGEHEGSFGQRSVSGITYMA